MPSTRSAGPRCAALVGPYLSGKTTLMESLLFAAGAVSRKGSVKDGNTVGDSAPEARARKMSVEVGLATAEYLGERWTFLDCPGSVELGAEAQTSLMVADVAVVVCEPVPDKAPMLAPLFKFLDDNGIPHILFINKVDSLGTQEIRVRDLMQALQAVSSRPLVLREVPTRDGDTITGYVDLVSERAYHYNPHAPSNLVEVPATVREREQTARQELLEALSDFDDSLLEQLLEDVAPDKEEIYRQLAKDLASDLIVPVFIGSAENDNGVRRLLKALRHEAPEAEAAAARLEIPLNGNIVVQVFKTYHAPHAGKLSFARVWKGTVSDGQTLGGDRVSGIYRMQGHDQHKLSSASTGEVVALGRMEHVATGEVLDDQGGKVKAPLWPDPPAPVYALAVSAEQRSDEVKLTGAIAKLAEEDPAFSVTNNADTGEIVLWGQGDIHLQLAMDRLRSKYNLPVRSRMPAVAYRETIRKPTAQHARFKRQTGGHGQFADVQVEIKPLPRGSGFAYDEKVVGGVVPRQFIPAVETGVKEYLVQGPLGFPVVDVAVTLISGQFHAVDSSEQAFKTAGRMAMSEGMPKCEPVLLEPILQVTIAAPTEFTPKVQRLITGRRGQILGFDGRPGWEGWDEVKALMPEAEVHDLIVELRSLTLGLGFFTTSFDHLAELTGRLADRAIEIRQSSVAAQ
ncbi:elongation factor G [Skermanella aerolata]|uniref:Elongation factor G n=1 Tax=Skermanella aerolata TaxID=393310 RepID=A0A512DVJ4_9PROT|nr:elongation factor G [Skermanella aerolata]KJB94931.1 elongation factor G [Skermanella aerolata KACC 11604]GEO40482.1 elongation factor G [Skermanella aerolata]